MNTFALLHKSKSEMAYAYDKDTLHLWLRTQKDDFKDVKLVYGDPFRYEPIDEKQIHWAWKHENANDLTMTKKMSDHVFDYYFIEIKPIYKRVKYAFILDDTYLYGAREIYDLRNDPEKRKKYNLFNYFNFPFLNEVDVINTPQWVKDTIWYEIFPDRFNRSKDAKSTITNEWGNPSEEVNNHMIFGGNINGIIEKLDYISDLGITGIYFTPLFEATSTHKYDTIDYFKIDPSFGTNEDFKRLVDESHKRGIKVVLDAVFNHCGYDHPFFQDVIKNGKNSPYYDCFFIKEEPIVNFKLNKDNKPVYTPGLVPNYHTFAFTQMMPKWNTENKIARKHLLDAAAYWIREYDIDGWRLDVSNEVSHDFWRAFRKTVLDAKNDAFIFGENWDYSMPWLQGDQFDSVMNYELIYPIWQFFGHDPYVPKIKASEFIFLINKLYTSYPRQVLESMFNLVDSHDTARILDRSLESKDLAYLTYLFMFSFPGTPTIYYGGEIGITGKGDPDNRRCMVWDESKQDLIFKERIKQLIHWKKTDDTFKSGDIEFVYFNDTDEVIGYKKSTYEHETYFFLNASNQERTVKLDFNLEGHCLLNNHLISNDEFRLHPYQALIIKTNKKQD